VNDEELARLVGRDFATHLERRAADLDGPVYAVALAAEYEYGQYLATMNSEAFYDRAAGVPGYRNAGRAELSGPTGIRWNTGEWRIYADDDFLSAETQQALDPLSTILKTGDDDEEWTRAAWRWVEIAFLAIDLGRPLTVLPATTPDAIAFVSFHDEGTPASAAAMQRNIPLDQFHALFPEWRQVAAAVRAVQADETRMQHLRDVIAAGQLMPSHGEAVRMPAQVELSASELGTLMASVGMSWASLVLDPEGVQQALDVADRS
jgi:hypothetical protein